MDNRYPLLIFTIVLLSAFLLFLALRLVVLTVRRRKLERHEPRNSRDLLVDALEAQTRRERQAEAMRHRTVLAYEALDALHGAVMAHLPVGILVLDADDAIQLANPYLMELFGVSRITGQPLADLSPALADLVDRTGGGAGEHPLTVTIADRPRHLRVSLTAMEERLLISVVDETRMRLLEEQVQYKRDLELMGELSSGVTHEVKNTLATISGLAQLLPYSDTGETSEKIVAEVNRLSGFIKEFTTAGKRRQLNRTHLDLTTWLREQQTRWLQQPNGPHVKVELPDTSTRLFADATLAAMVLDNLVRNGLEACEERSPEPPWVTVSADFSAAGVTFQVEDKGPGIPEHMRQRIFVPFVSSKQRGSGLGLFHCRKVMLEHGGRLEVQPGPPTRMSCFFPAASQTVDSVTAGVEGT
ncbi:MAG: ATP-binding protein [Acidobacteriota bacterium]|nr:ATP-binding protein [Acidobacteriota bacterium]